MNTFRGYCEKMYERDMSHCNCNSPKGFSCVASCKSRGAIKRTGGDKTFDQTGSILEKPLAQN